MTDTAELDVRIDPSQAIRGSRSVVAALNSMAAGAGVATTGLRSRIQAVDKSIFGLRSAILGLGTAAVLRNIVQTGVQFDSLNNSLKAVTGTTLGARQEFAFVEQLSDRLGVSLAESTRAYTKLAAAAKGTALEGAETRKIFTAVSEASRVLGLSADNTSGALRAIEQVMSKGTVQAEELRGQLGERIPGAFQIAARAMGVTTSQLNKMLENGEVLATDLLPKMAVELTNTFSPGLEDAINSPAAAFQRLDNAIVKLKLSVANSGLVDFFADLANEVSDFLPFLDFVGQKFGLLSVEIDKATKVQLDNRLMVLDDLIEETQKSIDRETAVIETGTARNLRVWKNNRAENIADLQKFMDERKKILERQSILVQPPKEVDQTPEKSKKELQAEARAKKAAEKERERLQDQFESLTFFLASEEEQIKESYRRRAEIAEKFFATNPVSEDRQQEIMSQLDKRRELELEALVQRKVDEETQNQDKFQRLKSFLSSEEDQIRESYRRRVEIAENFFVENPIAEDRQEEIISQLEKRRDLELQALEQQKADEETQNQDKFQRLKSFLSSEEDQIRESYRRRAEMVEGYFEQNPEMDEDRRQELLDKLQQRQEEDLERLAQLKASELSIEEEHQRAMLDAVRHGEFERVKVSEMTAATKRTIALEATSSILHSLGQFNKKAFKLAKVAAIAEGLVAVQGGIAKALNNPWPLNLAAAASVASAGAGIISNLRSLKDSGGGNPSFSSSPSAVAEEPSIPAPEQRVPENIVSEQNVVTNRSEETGATNVSYIHVDLRGEDESQMSTKRVRMLLQRMQEEGAVVVSVSGGAGG